MQGWNQVIVRSETGKKLVSLARDRGVLEFRETPQEALHELKSAAVEKKKKALARIIAKSRSSENLLHLNPDDPVVKKYLKELPEEEPRPVLKKRDAR